MPGKPPPSRTHTRDPRLRATQLTYPHTNADACYDNDSDHDSDHTLPDLVTEYETETDVETETETEEDIDTHTYNALTTLTQTRT